MTPSQLVDMVLEYFPRFKVNSTAPFKNLVCGAPLQSGGWAQLNLFFMHDRIFLYVNIPATARAPIVIPYEDAPLMLMSILSELTTQVRG